MSKSLSIRMYLKRQKGPDPEGKVPLYVRITIDGDQEDFSLSCKVVPDEWNQKKQAVTGKTQEARLTNSKINQVKGNLTTIFARFPVHEVVKAKHLMHIYFGEDPSNEPKIKKDINYHQKIFAFEITKNGCFYGAPAQVFAVIFQDEH
jgi:hypothetical protein